MTNSIAVYKCPDGTNFPVQWPSEEHEGHGWWWDQMHSPLPSTPLSMEFSRDVRAGFMRAFDVSGTPTYFETIEFNGYAYRRIAPFDDDPAVRSAIAMRDDAARTGRILEIWENDYRPEVEALTRATLSTAREARSLRQLVEILDQVHAARRRLGEIHMLAMGPANRAGERFVQFCVETFGEDGELTAAETMQGFTNKALESGIALWELSREAKARPNVAAVLAADRSNARERLLTVAGGREFLALLDQFLDAYGLRSESFQDLSFPTWREDPSFPLFLVNQYVNAPEEANPITLHDQAIRRREERIGQVEAHFAGEPEKLRTFHSLAKTAQQRTVILEDHNFYIDQRGWSSARFPLMQIGRRLAEQGTIDRNQDVFYLHEREIRKAAANPALVLSSTVAQRRKERDRWLRTVPPLKIGAGDIEADGQRDRFFGAIKEPSFESGILRGVAASKGVARGIARVIPSLEEIERLSPGEILVTHATSPPWTPLFAVAGAVVTEAGGILSHCAVVAREYQIPAVVGARGALQKIEDGMLITVDGTRGTV
ncbi:MAG TPA: PEP-utilizing enzyme, partial [Dehalococcoidia bacterium]|nr:PEP-utilizing enzyme [Dehalococcoidia bacterium]